MNESREPVDSATEDTDDIWAAALAEQANASAEADTKAPTADETKPDDEAKTPAPAASEAKPAARGNGGNAGDTIFRPLADESDQHASRDLDVIMDIPVTLSVELGSTRLSIRELLDLAKGSIVELDGLAGEPMDILVNGHPVAQGEVVVVDDKYGIRITEIIGRAERIRKLNR